MKLYKISQNIQYLGNIGVPESIRQEVLDYLFSLDKVLRRSILKKIKKNPTMNLSEIKELETDSKKDFLRQQGYEEEIVDLATSISPKYSVWLAREIKNYSKKRNKNQPSKHIYKPWENIGRDINMVMDYIKQNDPDIMSMSYEEVQNESEKWHEELILKQQEEDSTYKSHNVVYTLPTGWEIVKLESEDCEPEGNNMGHCVGGYSRDVAEGRTEIYSLRDTKNQPHVTIEMNTYELPKKETTYDFSGVTDKKYGIEIIQIQGKGNDEPIPEYKEMIKAWFQDLMQKGYEFDPFNEYGSNDVSVEDLADEIGRKDDYGIPISIDGIGGDKETYYENLKHSYNQGWHRSSYWSKGVATECIDNLILYAEQYNELDKLEGAIEYIVDWANEAWFE